jgi:uncharacterized DUF497 family protein
MAKHRANLRAHGIDFADAIAVFDGPTLERVDEREDYGEERWVAIGLARTVENHGGLHRPTRRRRRGSMDHFCPQGNAR